MTDTVVLTYSELSLEQAHAAVAHPSTGAQSLFVGTTRDNFDDKAVLSLEYHAYEPMAVKQMRQLCADARATCPDLIHIAVFHRLGSVPIGHSSVIIAVSSPHRRQAIGASTAFPPPPHSHCLTSRPLRYCIVSLSSLLAHSHTLTNIT